MYASPAISVKHNHGIGQQKLFRAKLHILLRKNTFKSFSGALQSKLPVLKTWHTHSTARVCQMTWIKHPKADKLDSVYHRRTCEVVLYWEGGFLLKNGVLLCEVQKTSFSRPPSHSQDLHFSHFPVLKTLFSPSNQTSQNSNLQGKKKSFKLKPKLKALSRSAHLYFISI